MRELPSTLWQRPVEAEVESRFSVGAAIQFDDGSDSGADARKESHAGAANTAPEIEALELLESLRADVTVALFNELTAAAIARPALAPILMDALDCALETLLLYKHPIQLCAVREWLMREVE